MEPAGEMEALSAASSSVELRLGEILELQGEPVTEEQAWALCYQLAALLSEGPGGVHVQAGRRRVLRLRGAQAVVLSHDGSISLRLEDDTIDDCFTCDTEDKVVDFIGRLIYSCLDWGLRNDVERELNESLEGLVCQMTKVTLSQNMESFQPVSTLAEVIQICRDRLYDPDQAPRHYKDVCCTLFSETVELCQYRHTIQHTKETLHKFVMDPETRSVQITTDWMFVWKRLVEELSRGMKLRPSVDRLNLSAPLPVAHSPSKQLLADIQLQRFKLRKVETVSNRHNWTDPHNSLLEFVRSRPKLRPASHRKLKTLPKEEASIHELLMEEIRTVDQQKLFSSHKRRLACKVSVDNIDSSSEDTSFLLNPSVVPELQEVDCEEDLHDEKLHPTSNITVDQELKFYPVLASSPMDPSYRCSRSKQRSRSLTNNGRLKSEKSNGYVCVPLTIAELIKERQEEMKALKIISCDGFINWRVCSCCSKRSMYFTWHNSCFLCNKVLCPECCIEMRLPFKGCMNLPVSFFKKIVLSRDNDQGRSQFWKERWSWDYSRVPLVLECQVMSSLPLHCRAMRDWYTQDICVGCKGYLLDACDSVIRLCSNSSPQEI
ncbi:protein spire homolog 1 isoform X2 [Scleropages formosus]|uniref:protein spire homolog 1 isoform X2 n=1 Tax=Scleropages formosus TaxID=113540 RepID=UPI0010FACDDD|nr:protein spire homolog 1-like isoform X2 [Scleropages formosus]